MQFKIAKKVITNSLGTVTRKTGNKTSATISLEPIDMNGEPLVGVNEQLPIIKVEGGKAKHLSAYYKNQIAYSVINEFSGRTGTELGMLMPTKNIKDFKIDELSEDVLASEKNGKIVDFEWKELDKDGKVIAEAKCIDVTNKDGVTSRKWYKHFYNAPIYLERFDNRGGEIKEEFRGKKREQVKRDAKGTYIETFSKYNYIAPNAIGIYPGQKVTDSGTLIDNTKGIYLVVTAKGTEGSVMPTPRKTSTTFSIAGMINNVLAHPVFGIMEGEHINEDGGVVKGKIKLSVKPTRIRLFDVDGNPDVIIEDAFRLESFRAKKTRTATTVEDAANTKEVIKNDLAQVPNAESAPAVITDEDEDLF